MDNITPLTPRTYAIKKALERYAMLHPAQASANKVRYDIQGFVTDMLVDLHLMAEEGGFGWAMHAMVEKASQQAIKELQNGKGA